MGELGVEWGNTSMAAMSSSSWQGDTVMTLYHTTAVKWAKAIVKEGFRPGHSGWCGGAIYFIDQPYLPRSKFAPGVTEQPISIGIATATSAKASGLPSTTATTPSALIPVTATSSSSGTPAKWSQ